MDSQRVLVDNLIVGFGFSVIPLLRELEARDQSYTLISEGDPIWQQLAANDRLDFDLVSSFHASFYAADQVESGIVPNYYPTAREFHAYHERLFTQYRHKVVEDTVCDVENHSDHSVVRTARGQIYQARNVVFATGLGRPQNETIKELDLREVSDKTIVFNAIGDTTNMMVAKAVPQGNKVILLNDGFIALDKFVAIDIPGPKGSEWYIPILGVRTGKSYPLDLAQSEAHTVERLWPKFYKNMFGVALGPPGPESWIVKLLLPEVFHVRHPETFRRDTIMSNHATSAGLSNGMIGIKYWPIDMYERRFGDDLEGAIRNGALMNDIVFYHTEGLVETWPKDRTSVDLENKTISCNGKTVAFDLFVDGGREAPRLPPITAIDDDGLRHAFSYDHRDNYLGVVPSKLRNIYFIGYTRPLTGGLANITEMQGLMVHKLLSEPERAEQLYETIHERLHDYNEHYYPHGQKRRPTDHLVHYGAYTNDVAHFIGIERRFRDCLSWNPWRTYMNLRFDLLHPNNALKFRMRGEYQLEGADEYCRDISAHYENWAIMMFIFLSALWDKLLGFLCLALLFNRYGLSPFFHFETSSVDWNATPNLVGWGALCTVLGVIFQRNLHIVNVATYSLSPPLFGLKAISEPLAMIYIASTGNWYLCLALFAFWAAVAFAFRQFFLPPISGRYLFADCKYKHKHRPFFERYRRTYEYVQAELAGVGESMPPIEPSEPPPSHIDAPPAPSAGESALRADRRV